MTETVARPQLSDRYTATSGRVQLTGVQALARLPIDQHRRDLAAGRCVGTFISGYEGSPLAGYDQELGRLKQLLDGCDVTFVPGLNEEAAATSVQGSQLACTLPGAARDGVIGIWYGKAPGLDRATDALRHGNLMGSHPRGGALVLVGDDPAAKSSTLPCASDAALADLSIPYLYPADSQDVLDLGRHAIELSRASGLWTGLKIVTGQPGRGLAGPADPARCRDARAHGAAAAPHAGPARTRDGAPAPHRAGVRAPQRAEPGRRARPGRRPRRGRRRAYVSRRAGRAAPPGHRRGQPGGQPGPPATGRHAVAARGDHRPRVRRRPEGDPGRRGETLLA